MTEFKVGDKVRIIGNCNQHEFAEGEVVRLIDQGDGVWRAEYLDGHRHWYVAERDMELVVGEEPIKPNYVCRSTGKEVYVDHPTGTVFFKGGWESPFKMGKFPWDNLKPLEPQEESEVKLSHDFGDLYSQINFNPINNPSHYGQGNIEAIEYIKDFLTEEEYVGYLRGNIAKYLHRWRYKGGLEDLKKAQVYLGWLIETQDKES